MAWNFNPVCGLWFIVCSSAWIKKDIQNSVSFNIFCIFVKRIALHSFAFLIRLFSNNISAPALGKYQRNESLASKGFREWGLKCHSLRYSLTSLSLLYSQITWCFQSCREEKKYMTVWIWRLRHISVLTHNVFISTKEKWEPDRSEREKSIVYKLFIPKAELSYYPETIKRYINNNRARGSNSM